MKIIGVALALAAALSGRAALADEATLKTALAGAEAQGFRGVVLVTDKDRTIWRGATAGAPEPGAVWPWASVTKQMVATLVMQEVQAGRLSLDDRLAKRFPTFKGPSASRITLRDLLRHTSGLPDPAAGPRDAEGAPTVYAQPDPRAVLNGYCSGPPRDEPGATFQYDNCDYLVLGAILEHATGKPFRTLVAERIARPSGAVSVGVFTPRANKGANAVGVKAGVGPRSVGYVSAYGASGALYGTAEDLAAVDRAILNGRLLGPEATAVMWTGEPKLGYAALGVWAFPTRLKGCEKPVRLIERRGDLGVQVRNVLAPDLGRAVVVFTDVSDFDFGEVWMGKGASFELLSAAFCG